MPNEPPPEQPKENLIDKLRKYIAKTGFPLELQVAALLQKLDHSVAHPVYYVDQDEQKGREIEIRARKTIHVIQNPECRLSHILFIDCKKSDDKQWVFFTSPRNDYDPTALENARGFPRDDSPDVPPEFKFEQFFGTNDMLALQSLNSFSSYPRLGRSHCQAFDNKDHQTKEHQPKDSIHQGIMASVKAALEARDAKQWAMDYGICFYHPMVVFQGQLFEAFLVDDMHMDIQEVKSVIVSFHYSSPKYDECRFLIPVVVASELERFITDLRSNLEETAQFFKTRPELFNPPNDPVQALRD